MKRKKPIDLLSPDDVSALVGQCSRRAPSGQRDAALIWVLYGAALRVSEALALKPRDVNTAKRQVRVRAGKGDKDRVVGLHPSAVPFIERWIATRKELGVTRAPLFCQITDGREGKPVSRQAVDAMLKRRAAKAGIEGRVHAHALRHSMAVRMYTKRPVTEVSKQLGHSNIAITTEYLSHLDASDLAAGLAEV